MCGRYTLTAGIDVLYKEFQLVGEPPILRPRFNIAPGQQVPVVLSGAERKITLCRWGLIPSWAKDPKIGQRLINARAETLREKPAFAQALRRRRCLILADGFFEWRRLGNDKVPMYIRLRSGKPFAFAGLWDVWRPNDEETVRSCTIVTTTTNALVAAIHDRMPAMLPPASYDTWLDLNLQEADRLQELLGPFPAELMEAYEVPRLVNSPANDGPECITPARSATSQSRTL